MTYKTEYIHRNLTIQREEIKKPFGAHRGFTTGTVEYIRKDGQRIKQEDLDHLKKLDFGQIHVVRGEPDDEICSIYFECDSTD